MRFIVKGIDAKQWSKGNVSSVNPLRQGFMAWISSALTAFCIDKDPQTAKILFPRIIIIMILRLNSGKSQISLKKFSDCIFPDKTPGTRSVGK